MRVLFRLLGYLGRHRGLTALGVGALLCGLALQLTIPLYIRQAIDTGIIGGNTTALLYSSLAIVGLTLLQTIFHYGRTYLLESLAQRVVYDMRNDISPPPAALLQLLRRGPDRPDHHQGAGTRLSFASSSAWRRGCS